VITKDAARIGYQCPTVCQKQRQQISIVLHSPAQSSRAVAPITGLVENNSQLV
jgi:hypothetical protein